MNRLAKFFRSFGGVCMLLQIAACFCPVLMITQENYPKEQYSAVNFLLEAFELLKKGTVNQHVILIGSLVLIPAILALIMGIVGIVASSRQIVSCIFSILISSAYIAFCFLLPRFWPEPINSAQVYQKAFGYWCIIGVSGLSAICGIAGIITTPKKNKGKEEALPFLGEEPKNIQTPAPKSKPTVTKNVSVPPVSSFDDVTVALDDILDTPQNQSPRGVLVGLTGIYRGAEIPFQPGETLKLGRDMSNDLIFEGETKVSRFHCAISWYPEIQKFRIVDQSANGCFVNGSEDCLPQNMEIELVPGTILSIGDQKNIFRLD